MSGESLEEFYGQLHGLEEPWEVQEVIRDAKACEVRVIMASTDPGTGLCLTHNKETRVQDHRMRLWRHLDSCNHQTITEAEIPRVKCSESLSCLSCLSM